MDTENNDSEKINLDCVDPAQDPGSAIDETVLFAELKAVSGSREHRLLRGSSDYLSRQIKKHQSKARIKPSIRLEVVGLALSGGGIRSSTFCLGVLQSLNEAGVIKWVDYLSTVSGGGYIGSFWSCLLQQSRLRTGRRAVNSEEYLSNDIKFKENGPLFRLSHVPGVEEGREFQRLRNYANYLKPRNIFGLMRLPAILMRGLVINFIITIPYILLLSALSIYLFEEQIRSGHDAFGGVLQFENFRIYYSVLLLFIYFVLLIVGTAGQSILRGLGRSHRSTRRQLIRLYAQVLLVVVLVAVIEFQPIIINWFDSKFMSSNSWSVPGIGTVGGLTAFLSAASAAKSSKLNAKIGLGIAALIIPIAISCIYFAMCAWPISYIDQNTDKIVSSSDKIAFIYVILAGMMFLVTNFLFDVNATSLHNYYRDSLTKTFLFSVRQSSGGQYLDRDEDEVALGDIDVEKSGGPFHLINAVVNNPDLDKISLRGRKSEFFTFSSLYSGNNRLGYCPTKKLEQIDPSINLGTAMAISAAAASPNMGQKTANPLVIFIMAILNVRLGYWLPRPQYVCQSSAVRKLFGFLSPNSVGPFYFLLELFGLPRRFGSRFINLSDGGHLENLGVFELLRRRCEYIIAVDAEADEGMNFNGLATLTRLARTDLGIDIEIDLDDLRKDENGFSRRHWALGKINYGADHGTGMLLYVKASVTGSENEYVTEYRARHPSFPHQSTADQFFDEEQFEAYRSLGYKVGASLFYKPSDEFVASGAYKSAFEKFKEIEYADQLFDQLAKRDTSAIVRRESFFRLLDRRREIEVKMAKVQFAHYASELVDLPSALTEKRAAVVSQELEYELYQLVNEQMQLVEAAIFALRLYDPKFRRRKSNLGWMNLFRRWAQAPTFQKYWAVSIAHYGTALMQFFQEEFQLGLSVRWSKFNVRADKEMLTPSESEALLHAKALVMKLADDPTEKPQVYVAQVAASGHAVDGKGGCQVALALTCTINGGPSLVDFSVRASYQSIGLARVLLSELKADEAVWGTSEPNCADPAKAEGLRSMERTLNQLGYIR